MVRLATTFIVGGILGTALGFVLGIFVYPYIFLADIVADETLDTAGRQVVATGGFIHVNPSDPVHWGKGAVTVYQDAVHLEQDFEVGPGPKYHVYLVPGAPVTSAADVTAAMFIDLGRLRAFKGSQVYRLPAGLKPSQYRSVVIWCEQFGVLISPAALKFAAS